MFIRFVTPRVADILAVAKNLIGYRIRAGFDNILLGIESREQKVDAPPPVIRALPKIAGLPFVNVLFFEAIVMTKLFYWKLYLYPTFNHCQ